MSVLIRGMEMPQDGEMLCINIYPDGKVCIDLDLECKQIATAVPVPPHGRLIDADALTKILFHYFEKSGVRDTLEALIRTEPTIIPASEEGE